MSKHPSLRYIGLAGVIFAVSVFLVGLFIREILNESDMLENQVTALQLDQQQETQLAQLRKIYAETEADRGVLASYYLESKSESIDFLNFVEEIAASRAIELETLSATDIEREDEHVLEVVYDLRGSRGEVDRFISLLEVLPYMSTVSGVSLSRLGGASWEAQVTIEVQLLHATDS